MHAFAGTNLKELNLLGTDIMLIGEGAFNGIAGNKEKITKPYYMSNSEFELALKEVKGC